ncbi:MAG: pyridoxal 5'-phosphate synthase glutaminase subunit PdxT [Candidatus Rifleibacteriota bacterium]
MPDERFVIGVLGLQGAVREHLKSLEKCDVRGIEVKSSTELEMVQGLIVPGGESTAIRRLLDTSDMVAPLIRFCQSARPIFGTCAGLILMARKLTGGESHNLGLMNIEVARNSFGRQVDSFETDLNISGFSEPFPAVFIRAPHIVSVGSGVEILATCQDRIVMVREKHLLGCSFHPELTNDERITRYFIRMVEESLGNNVQA